MTESEPSGVNVPLLRKAVEWAEAEAMRPEGSCTWDQMNWVQTPEMRARRDGFSPSGTGWDEQVRLAAECGTAYCIAGYVAGFLGGQVFLDGYNGEDEHIAEVAARALGIPEPEVVVNPEAGHLFNGENTIADVRRIAEDLAGERL